MPGSFAAGILAGGKSTRMGTDKAFLDVGGKPLIRYMIDKLSTIATDVVISTRDASKFKGLPGLLFTDRFQTACAMVGVHTALSTGKPVMYVTAVDMPYLNTELVNHLRKQLRTHDAVVPRSSRGFEPLSAVYTLRCLPALEKCISKNQLMFSQLFRDLNVKFVEVKDDEWRVMGVSPFTNLNEPRDYDAFVLRLQGKEPR